MGAFNWRATLLRGRKRIQRWREAGSPVYLQPWRHDGSKLAFPLCSRAGNRVLAAAADGSELPSPNWPSNVYLAALLWAPTRDRVLLVGSEGGGELLDGDFRPVAHLRWRPEQYEHPLAGWLTPDAVFFVLSLQGGADLRFYSAVDGSLIDALPLDPAAILPYDEDAVADVPRDGYALDLGPGLGGVGGLLDTWSFRRYRPDTAELILQTYRPVGSPSPDGLRAEAHWVAVKLSD